MRAVIKRAGQGCKVEDINNDLRTLQSVVGGYIECLPIGNGICIVCNENGKLDGLPPNFVWCGDIIVGDVLFVGEDGEDFCSLTENQIKQIYNEML